MTGICRHNSPSDELLFGLYSHHQSVACIKMLSALRAPLLGLKTVLAEGMNGDHAGIYSENLSLALIHTLDRHERTNRCHLPLVCVCEKQVCTQSHSFTLEYWNFYLPIPVVSFGGGATTIQHPVTSDITTDITPLPPTTHHHYTQMTNNK